MPTVSSQRCLVATVTLNLSLLKAIYLEFTKDSTFQVLLACVQSQTIIHTYHFAFCVLNIQHIVYI